MYDFIWVFFKKKASEENETCILDLGFKDEGTWALVF